MPWLYTLVRGFNKECKGNEMYSGGKVESHWPGRLVNGLLIKLGCQHYSTSSVHKLQLVCTKICIQQLWISPPLKVVPNKCSFPSYLSLKLHWPADLTNRILIFWRSLCIHEPLLKYFFIFSDRIRNSENIWKYLKIKDLYYGIGWHLKRKRKKKEKLQLKHFLLF